MNNLDQLKMKQEQQQALAARQKELATDSVDFKANNEKLCAVTREIEDIMKAIERQNKKTSAMMNESQEHVIGQFINASNNPLLNINSI